MALITTQQRICDYCDQGGFEQTCEHDACFHHSVNIEQTGYRSMVGPALHFGRLCIVCAVAQLGDLFPKLKEATLPDRIDRKAA